MRLEHTTTAAKNPLISHCCFLCTQFEMKWLLSDLVWPFGARVIDKWNQDLIWTSPPFFVLLNIQLLLENFLIPFKFSAQVLNGFKCAVWKLDILIYLPMQLQPLRNLFNGISRGIDECYLWVKHFFLSLTFTCKDTFTARFFHRIMGSYVFISLLS